MSFWEKSVLDHEKDSHKALRVLPACLKPWTQLKTSVLETRGGVTTDDIRAMVEYPGSIHFILNELRSHTGFGAIG